MAHILVTLDTRCGIRAGSGDVVEEISLGTLGRCCVVGAPNTYEMVRDGDDAVVAVGYCSFLTSGSAARSLATILDTFDESRIGALKRELVGQYVLLVKKGGRVWVFADFMGARNVFYSREASTVSTSLSRIEELIEADANDLDPYKIGERLAVKHILYPAWLGSSTCNKRIDLLYPFEYLCIDPTLGRIRVGSVVFSIDNRKEGSKAALADGLVAGLRSVIARQEFKQSPVAVSLSGGRDSRLVAGLAVEYYEKPKFRIAVSPGHRDSTKDMHVAETIAKRERIPLLAYESRPGIDNERFEQLTERMAPAFNDKLAPLLDDAGSFAIGFGGVFGTELFMPVPWRSIDEFVRVRTAAAREAIKAEGEFWIRFEESLREEFRAVREHYELAEVDQRDYVRLFMLLNTARYASFILAAFNEAGYQLEPYGSYSAFSLAFRVAPALWGNHRRFGGDALIQLAAMQRVSPRMAGVLTYKNFRPMRPLSARSFPLYVWGTVLQARDVVTRRLDGATGAPLTLKLPIGFYSGSDWALPFLRRTTERYGMPDGGWNQAAVR